MYKNINLIVACQKDWGIARGGKIPWYAPKDLRSFKRITIETSDPSLRNAVIMGRETCDSIGRMLPGRFNYVITRNEALLANGHDHKTELLYVSSIQKAIESASANPTVEKLFIIGGGTIYQQVLLGWAQYLHTAYVTVVDTGYVCNQHLSQELFEKHFKQVSENKDTEANGVGLVFKTFRAKSEEEQYLDLMKNIIENGESRDDRTNVGTVSLFGARMEFDISQRLPILTTKRTAWKTVLRELLWFISGDTNAKNSQTHIWDANSSREFLDKRGLQDLPDGDIGAGYGFQWRHFGAEYVDCNTDYTEKGYDQLTEVIRMLKEEPTSRRIILSAWNPSALHRMALPPCHLLTQFYVRNGTHLDCQMYQRSGDMALGVPFNIASYSLLTYMIAHVTGLHPGRFIHVLGDAHVYKNHLEGVKEQLSRVSYPFPRLQINRRVECIDDFKETDFELLDYVCHPAIKLEMAL